jgi:hypothetical protein
MAEVTSIGTPSLVPAVGALPTSAAGIVSPNAVMAVAATAACHGRWGGCLFPRLFECRASICQHFGFCANVRAFAENLAERWRAAT